MRRHDKEISDLKQMHDIIHRADVCRLALIDGDKPYIIPLNFGFDGQHIFFHSAPEGKKLELLKSNSKVCVEFEDHLSLVKGDSPCSWGYRYATVVATGETRLIIDDNEKTFALNHIISHYDKEPGQFSFTEQQLSKVVVYKIIIEEISGKFSG